MLTEQVQHEQAINATSRALAVSHDMEQRRVNTAMLVALIKARDPEVTRRLEALRLHRVGLS